MVIPVSPPPPPTGLRLGKGINKSEDVSIAYNLSVSLALYSLILFYRATSFSLTPFRPLPKFLCVKGILFATFWQGFIVSILVAMGWIKSVRFDQEVLGIAIQDTTICLEMPGFALLHLFVPPPPPPPWCPLNVY